jgi:hypothetical protein
MLMDATGEPVKKVGDSFVVHMDREALNDYPMGLYDVTVTHYHIRLRHRDRLDHPWSDPTRPHPGLLGH